MTHVHVRKESEGDLEKLNACIRWSHSTMSSKGRRQKRIAPKECDESIDSKSCVVSYT